MYACLLVWTYDTVSMLVFKLLYTCSLVWTYYSRMLVFELFDTCNFNLHFLMISCERNAVIELYILYSSHVADYSIGVFLQICTTQCSYSGTLIQCMTVFDS